MRNPVIWQNEKNIIDLTSDELASGEWGGGGGGLTGVILVRV